MRYSMSKLPEELLKHILDEINYLLETSQNVDEAKFSEDQTLQRAFVRSLEIIGEATKNLSQDFKLEHSEVDWKSMAGMRDRLIHGYFGVDYQIIWDVIKTEVPELKPKITSLLSDN